MDRNTPAQEVTVPAELRQIMEDAEASTELSQPFVGMTARKLVGRIDERFSDCELKRLAQKVEKTVANSRRRLRGPYALGFLVRLVVWPCVFAALGAVGYGIYCLDLKVQVNNGGEFVQGLDSALQVMIMLAAGTWFFLTLGNRLVRNRLLKAVQELRAQVHMIDLLQLDKDPDRLFRKEGENTATSPQLGKVSTPFLLSRYLDYCSELLSLISKVAALYSEQVKDPVVLAELSEIEKLTNQYRLTIGTKMASISNLSAKVSQ
jgi:hypothetical protein